MALLVSSNDFIKTNESAIRDQIQASLDMMDSKQVEEFGKNVASLVDLVNESAQQALSRITTGYYTPKEKEKELKEKSDAATAEANILKAQADEATRVAKKAEDDAKKAEDDAKKSLNNFYKSLKGQYEKDKKFMFGISKVKDTLKSYTESLGVIKETTGLSGGGSAEVRESIRPKISEQQTLIDAVTENLRELDIIVNEFLEESRILIESVKPETSTLESLNKLKQDYADLIERYSNSIRAKNSDINLERNAEQLSTNKSEIERLTTDYLGELAKENRGRISKHLKDIFQNMKTSGTSILTQLSNVRVNIPWAPKISPVDATTLQANLDTYATQQDAKKEFELLIKASISTIEGYKKGFKDSIKNPIDKLLAKVKLEIDELKKSRHEFAVEKMNRQLSSLQIEKETILSTIDNLIRLITDRINILERVLPLIKKLKTSYSRYIDFADRTINNYKELIKKIYKSGIDIESKNKIDSDFSLSNTHIIAEIVAEEIQVEAHFEYLRNTLGGLMDIKRFTELAGPIDAPKPTKDKIDDIKGFVKFLEARNSDMKKLEAQFKLNKQDTKSKDIISSTGIRPETKLTSSGVDIPLNVPQFAAEGRPQELVPPATPTIAPLEVEGGPVTEQGPLAIRGNVNLGTPPSRQVEYERERPSQEEGGIELQPITRAQPPVEGEAAPAAAPSVGEDVAVAEPAEAPAEETAEQTRANIRDDIRRIGPMILSNQLQGEDLETEVADMKEKIVNVIRKDPRSSNNKTLVEFYNLGIINRLTGKLTQEKINTLKLAPPRGGRSSYRRRMKKGRKTFRRHK